MRLSILKNRSLRWKINLLTVMILLVLAIVFGVLLSGYELSRRSESLTQIEEALNDLTEQYAEQVGNEIFASQALAARQTLKELCARRHLLAITSYTETGQFFVSSSEQNEHDLPPDLTTGVFFPVVEQTRWGGKSVVSYLTPIIAYGEKVGFWVIRYDLSTLNYQSLEIIALFIALILSVSVFLGLLLNKILLRFVVDPVRALQQAMQNIQAGETGPVAIGQQQVNDSLDRMMSSFDQHTESLSVHSETNDEIDSLADSFRNMLFALKKAYIDVRTDTLTLLPNRLKLDEGLEQEVKRALAGNYAVSVILVDIDHFKKINDNYGHLVGDQVLKQLAEILMDQLKEAYLVGRWGGEEFLVLLPETCQEKAVVIAETLRSAIDRAQFKNLQSVTASFGVSSYVPGDSVDHILRRADIALYQAKENGRNQVANA